ncbi:hypothetical protein [Methylophilus luteus]|uniref:Uncharacterized protein n=1 Tax=Methylophilus luteus TaxID=640108 RepID=A0ABW3F5Y8_9PROT
MADLFSDMIDIESYLPKEGKWLSLNSVYNNLQWYPLLIIYFALIKFLFDKGDILEQVSACFLLVIWLFLMATVSAQTAVVMVVIIIGVFIHPYKPNWLTDMKSLADNKLIKSLFWLAIFLLTWISILTALAILKAMISLKVGL